MAGRKYRQKGYMDGERGREGGERRPGAPPRREGPRGRGLGAPTESRFQCARCGREQRLAGPVVPETVCGGCGSDLHTCTNCRHFDTSARFECRQEIPERIAAKARRNTCEPFEPKETRGFAADAGRDTPQGARAAFDALFES